MTLATLRPLVLGIDPGLSGAWALYDALGDRLIAVDDLPTTGGTPASQRIDVANLFHAISTACEGHVEAIGMAVIEDVSAMPGQGVSSMFRFGRACGALEAMLVVQGLPHDRVAPATWMKAMRLKGGEGDLSRDIAIRTYPDHAPRFARKADHNRAEAALLARWGTRLLPTLTERAS